MKFVAKHDIEAPLDFVYRTLTDFESWERSVMRRGVEVYRTDDRAQVGAGMRWKSRFAYRGKEREIAIHLLALDAGGQLSFLCDTRPAAADIKIDLLEMAAKRTRMVVSMEAKPKTLGARLFLQTLRLTKGRVDAKFAQRLAHLAGEIEVRYRGH